MQSIEFPLSFLRQYAGPLEASSVFSTLAELNTYIASNPTAYAGQVVSVSNGSDSGIYVISQNIDAVIKQASANNTYTKTEVDDKVAQVNAVPNGYVETNVTICQNGSPVTGTILFKAN